jgi:predicted nucleic acid-binding protein
VEPGAADVLDAIDNSLRWRLSFWDAMLVTAANKTGASVLWSEDLNPGQRYGGVTVQNPFA